MKSIIQKIGKNDLLVFFVVHKLWIESTDELYKLFKEGKVKTI